MRYEPGLLDQLDRRELYWERPAPLFLSGVGLVSVSQSVPAGLEEPVESEGHRHRLLRPTQLHRPSPVRCYGG